MATIYELLRCSYFNNNTFELNYGFLSLRKQNDKHDNVNPNTCCITCFIWLNEVLLPNLFGAIKTTYLIACYLK